MNTRLERAFTGLFAAVLLLHSGLIAAAPLLTIPKVPFYIGQNVPPNLLLTLDDSGSMQWAYVPDNFTSVNGGTTHIAFKSNLNGMYYDPTQTYTQPTTAAGVPLTTSFTRAWVNGFDPSRGWIDLSDGYRPNTSYSPNSTSISVTSHCRSGDRVGGNCPGVNVGQSTATRGYYWTYVPGPGCPAGVTPGPGFTPANSCFQFNWVQTAEEQNFANWYSFYRNRNLATVSAASLAFKDLPADYRVGWQALNSCIGASNEFTSSCRGWTGTSVDARVEIFTDPKKADLFSWMQRLPASGGTPLTQAFDRVGRYLQLTGSRSPYADNFGISGTTSTSCRQSYSVTMTDGIWNGSGPFNNPGNADSKSQSTPDGRSYTARAPFADNNSNVLADLAFKYWITDLQPGLDNNVKPFMPFSSGATVEDDEYWDPRNDPANWQHMTSFFVGLGLGSSLTNPDWQGGTFAGSATAPFTGYPAFLNGANWPSAGSNNNPGNVYDMWHGAINGRGEFFSADTPDALVQAFRKIRNRIDEQSGAVSSAAGSSLQVQTDSAVYGASYNSNKWEGELSAFKVNADGSVSATRLWTTDNTFNTLGPAAWAANNKVLTRSASGGLVTLNPSNLTMLPAAKQVSLASQAAALGVSVQEMVQWILGDTSNASLRRRDKLLGDLLNSAPVFEGGRDYGYIETMWSDSPRIDGKVYADYLKKKGERGKPGFKPTVYAGSNDGMLHAFNADTGQRRFSFIPSPALEKIGERASPNYSHEYYVDGPITLHDVHNGTEWRTILVASTGAGARGLFALDVTNPDAPLLLWEYFPSDDDLGHILGEPVVARAENGDWVVVFGNGVGSESNEAVLYVIDALNGGLKKKVKAGNRVTTSANGLSAPALLYLAGKRLGFAYAGDLQGNLWRFATSNSPSSFQLDFGNKPILEARGPGGKIQPITAKPRIASDRILGRMIIVGTGKLIEISDKNNTEVQTLYGVFDRAGGGAATRAQMTPQTITAQAAGTRQISSTALSSASAGWYLDLTGWPGTNGERVTQPVVYVPELSLILASTIRVSGDACTASISSWVMAMSPFSGSGVNLFAALGGGGSPGAGYFVEGTIAVPSIMRKGSKATLIFNKQPSGLETIDITKGWNSRSAWRQVR